MRPTETTKDRAHRVEDSARIAAAYLPVEDEPYRLPLGVGWVVAGAISLLLWWGIAVIAQGLAG